jgi:hypothetical protein
MKLPFVFLQLLIITLLFLSELTAIAQNKIQQKLSFAIRTEGGYIDTTTTKEVYNRKGQLILREQPKYYCTEQYEYDSLNRLITEDILCGESNGNGITKLAYHIPYKIIHQGDFGAYPTYMQEDSLNTVGLKTVSKKWRSSINDDSLYTEIRYVYTTTHKILSKKEFVQNYYKENNQWIADLKTYTEQKYVYDAKDSLQKIIFTNLLTNQSSVLEEYFYNMKGQVEKIVYAYNKGFSQKIFSYNVKNQLVKAKFETQDIAKKTWLLESQTDFVYKNGELVEEHIKSYWQGNFRSTIINYYEKGLLVRSTEANQKNKIVEKTTYTYMFFE